MTPLAPCEPQMAVAAASFSTVMSAISSTLTASSDEKASSSALSKSMSAALYSKILSSTTISGSALPFSVDTPRRRIDVPAPRLPEFVTISRPAIPPCRASSAEVKAIPSTSAMLIVCCETEISRLSMFSPPEVERRPTTFTSPSVVLSSSSLILKVLWSPMVIIFVLLPT